MRRQVAADPTADEIAGDDELSELSELSSRRQRGPGRFSQRLSAIADGRTSVIDASGGSLTRMTRRCSKSCNPARTGRWRWRVQLRSMHSCEMLGLPVEFTVLDHARSEKSPVLSTLAWIVYSE